MYDYENESRAFAVALSNKHMTLRNLKNYNQRAMSQNMLFIFNNLLQSARVSPVSLTPC